LDGTVARRQGTVSKFGGYLDAVIDRYQEIAAYLVLGIVNGWATELFLLTTGSLLTSYNKAAAAIEMPIDDKGWPDLMERPRRIWIFCAALILDNAIPVPGELGGRFIYIAICYLAVLTHFTCLQRILRARRWLLSYEARLSAGIDPRRTTG
jgi:phosphatidylglycerophosphate synthase